MLYEVITTLGNRVMQPVGFAEEEALLPFTRRSFPGYRLLLEYFTFAEKFLFVDLFGLERVSRLAGGRKLAIEIFLDRLPKSKIVLDQDTFTLNAAPAVNLFSRIAEPIRIDHRKPEYPVIPDIRRTGATEVFIV